MTDLKQHFAAKTWTRNGYTVSMDASTISIPKLIQVFDSEECHWSRPLPAEYTKSMLENSMNWVIFDDSSSDREAKADRNFIGMARCVTDFVTFAYLTDVWVEPAMQGKGLGRWMVECIAEVLDEMPYLRRSLLFTSDWERSVPFYEKILGFELLRTEDGEGTAILSKPGKGNAKYYVENKDD